MKILQLFYAFIFLLLVITIAQEFKELPPPDNLVGNFYDNTVTLNWQVPTDWDSLEYNVFKAIVFDTTNINAENLEFQIIASTRETEVQEKYKNVKNLSHIAFMYYVVAMDTNNVESLRSNYCLVNIL